MTQHASDGEINSLRPPQVNPAAGRRAEEDQGWGGMDDETYQALRRRFYENRDKVPEDHLTPYLGQWVAWWPDGSRIVDADEDFDALWSRLRDGGYNVYELELEHIPFPCDGIV
jgi:hypothetical protein